MAATILETIAAYAKERAAKDKETKNGDNLQKVSEIRPVSISVSSYTMIMVPSV